MIEFFIKYFDIIMGNVFSTGGNLLDMVAVSKNTGKKMLLTQIISFTLYGISALFLKAYSSMVQNIFGIARNIFAILDVKSRIVDALMIILPVAVGIYVNNMGAIGLMPVFANLVYSYAVIKLNKDIVKLKAVFVFSTGMFAVFNFIVYNYSGCLFGTIVTCYAVKALIKAIKDQKTIKREENTVD